MATKKAGTKKKAAPKKAKTTKSSKAVKKSSPKKKQKELKSGSSYECYVCGLEISVDSVCGCVDFCDIICCGEQMKPMR
jgi:hypothetical protein